MIRKSKSNNKNFIFVKLFTLDSQNISKKKCHIKEYFFLNTNLLKFVSLLNFNLLQHDY